MLLTDFDFELPVSSIALEPLRPVHSSKILHVTNTVDLFYVSSFFNITDFITSNDLIIFNDTKVLPVRLSSKLFKNNKTFEITLNKQIKTNHWTAFIKNSKKIDVDDVLSFSSDFSAKVILKDESGLVHLEFNLDGDEFYTHLHKNGLMPLPPYISKQRDVEKKDHYNYQTVFAKNDGAIAAPTAGLHFSNDLLEKIKDHNIKTEFITLHVGAGTFLPVKEDDITNHKMHSEYFEVTDTVVEAINETKRNGGRVIAVGTTVLRALESCASDINTLEPFYGETSIFITPGYQFKIVDCLVTNFHLPKSTLFMLVCAFAGIKKMKKAYQYAIDNNFRFYSFGDGCFLERSNNAINE